MWMDIDLHWSTMIGNGQWSRESCVLFGNGGPLILLSWEITITTDHDLFSPIMSWLILEANWDICPLTSSYRCTDGSDDTVLDP